MKLYDAPQVLGFLSTQATHIEAEVDNVVFADIVYPSLIPIDTSAHPFTQTVEYRWSEGTGRAEWINGNADDVPTVSRERGSKKTSVFTAALGYEWGWEEINTAMLYGVDVSAEGAIDARRGAEEMCQRVAFLGDAEKNFAGLINYPGVVVKASAGTWMTADAQSVLTDINNILIGTAAGINGWTIVADTVLLPPSRLNRLNSILIPGTTGAGMGLTTIEFLSRANIYTQQTGKPLKILGFAPLETAGSGNSTRAVGYRRSPEVLKMHIPMPHQFLSVHQRGPLTWEVPGVMRLGGLDIRRLQEVVYMDGI